MKRLIRDIDLLTKGSSTDPWVPGYSELKKKALKRQKRIELLKTIASGVMIGAVLLVLFFVTYPSV